MSTGGSGIRHLKLFFRILSNELAGDFQVIMASPKAAYAEAVLFFKGAGMMNDALSRLAADLDRHSIGDVVIGAVALNQYGFHRLTVDIDLLMTSEALHRFSNEVVGSGYRPAFEGARKRFRTVQDNIPIAVITSGEYSGDGLPKPAAFPDPADAGVDRRHKDCNAREVDRAKTRFRHDRSR